MNFDHLARNLREAAKSTTQIDPQYTAQLLDTARCLVKKLEPPEDAVFPLAKLPLANAVLRVAFKMNIFETFDDDKAKTINDISSRVGADSLLVARIMRVLASVSIFFQEDENTYAHTVSSRALMSPTYRDLVACWVESIIPFSHLPDYLSSINYRNPDDPDNSLFHYASGTKLNYFQFMQTRPDMMETFSKGMAASVRLQGSHLPASISALFPSDPNTLSLRSHQGSASSYGHSVSVGDKDPENLPEPESEDKHVLLVDVGGGRGSILQDLRRMRPDLRGRLIVQDLAKEIDGREIAEGVEGMTFDFMLPQPVKNASVYFFRHIFHDWPDSTCRHILEKTIPALDPHHSRIVIVDIVLPDSNAKLMPALFDINMMLMGGRERTEREWRGLLKDVGLRVTKITGPEPGAWTMDSVIEAVIDA